MSKQLIEEFIDEFSKDISKEEQQDNYCVILYKTKGSLNERSYVHKIYKSLDEFKNKIEKDIEKIDSSYGLRIQGWYFD